MLSLKYIGMVFNLSKIDPTTRHALKTKFSLKVSENTSENQSVLESPCSAVSRAILKPVYQFGIPNSDPKLSKVLISGISFRHRSLSQSHESDVLSLFRMQNTQDFPGLCPWTHWRELTAPPRLTSSLLRSSKNRHPQKISEYGTALL